MRRRVRDYAAGVSDPELQAKYLQLADEIDNVYQAEPLTELLEADAKIAIPRRPGCSSYCGMLPATTVVTRAPATATRRLPPCLPNCVMACRRSKVRLPDSVCWI